MNYEPKNSLVKAFVDANPSLDLPSQIDKLLELWAVVHIYDTVADRTLNALKSFAAKAAQDQKTDSILMCSVFTGAEQDILALRTAPEGAGPHFNSLLNNYRMCLIGTVGQTFSVADQAWVVCATDARLWAERC